MTHTLKSRLTACASALTVTMAITLMASPAIAQVVTDGTTGAATTLTGPSYTIPDTLGTTNSTGTTLLHSFSQFDLVNGDTATFTGAATITDVIARITGGAPSSIDGTVNLSIPNANLYLLNPDGIIIGANGYFNVPGSLYITTANRLTFLDQTAIDIAATPVGTLSTTPVASFGFIGGAIGGVTVNGVSTVVGGVTSYSYHGFIGGDLTIVGADVSINNSTFNTGTSTLTEMRFGAIGQNDAVIGRTGQFGTYDGTLSLTSTATNQKSNVYLSGGDIVITAGPSTARSNIAVLANDPTSVPGPHISGSIFVQGDTLTLTDSSLVSSHYTGNPDAYTPGVIDVDLTGNLTASNAYIGGSATSAGRAYNIDLQAANISLTNATNIMAFSSTNNAGTITLTTTGGVTLTNNSHLHAGAEGTGNGGAIVANIGGQLSLANTTGFGVYSNYAGTGAGAAAGTMTINAGSLNINNGELAFQGFYNGRAGGTVNLNVTNNAVLTSTGLPTIRGNGSGSGGTFNMTVGGTLTATGPTIDVSSGSFNGTSNGGNVTLTVAGALTATNALFNAQADSATAAQTGNGGNITVSANSITTTNTRFMLGAGLNASSNLNRSGGNLSITTLQAASFTGGLDLFDVSSNIGPGGSITLNIGSNLLLDSGEIDAGSFVAGPAGGRVTITAGGTITDHSTSIFNDGGDITLTASQINLLADGFMRLSTDTEYGAGGQILLQAPVINLGMDTNTDIVLLQSGPQGDIVVRAETLNMGSVEVLSDGRAIVGDPLFPDATHTVLDAGDIGLYATNFNIGPDTIIHTFADNNAGSITLGARDLNAPGGLIETTGQSGGTIRLAADNSMALTGLTVNSTVTGAGAQGTDGNIYIGYTLSEPNFASPACSGPCLTIHPFSTTWTPGTQSGIPGTYADTGSAFAALGNVGQVIMGFGNTTTPDAIIAQPSEATVAPLSDEGGDTTSGMAFAYGDRQDAARTCAVEGARRRGRNTLLSTPTDIVIAMPGAVQPERYGSGDSTPGPMAMACQASSDGAQALPGVSVGAGS